MRRPRLALSLAAVLALSLAPAVSSPAAAPAPSAGATGAGDRYYPRQGNGGYDVASYALALSYATNPKRISGTATIRARATQALSRFSLDLRRNLRVSSLTVDGVPAVLSRPKALQQELLVRPRAPLARGKAFTVVVRYGGKVAALRDPNGSLDGMVTTKDGVVVVAEPQGAPTWYPVNDTPRDKATYAVTVSVPRSLVAVSNGLYRGRTTAGARTTYRWAQTQPVSSYLVTLAIGKFAVRTGKTRSGIPYFNAADPTQRGGLKRLGGTPKIIEYFASKFGPYPFSATGGIVENASFLGYALETASRPVYDRTPSVQTLAHELAHQWFGDSVTLKRWRDIWLNEGFAQFAMWLWDEHRGVKSARTYYRQLMSVPASNSRVWNPPPGNPRNAASVFAGSVYNRGAATLQALRQKVGDKVFFRILRGWAAAHRYGNATVPQFTAYAAKVSGRNLSGFFHEWLYRSGKPRQGHR